MVTTLQIVAEFVELTDTYTRVDFFPTIRGIKIFTSYGAFCTRDYSGMPTDINAFVNQDLADIKTEMLYVFSYLSGGQYNGLFQFDSNQTSVCYLNTDLPPGAVATMNSTIAGKASASSVTRTSSALSASLTTGTGNTGTQISATKASTIRATCSCSTTATIGGASTSFVVAEICATNSNTPGDWVEVARIANDQTITLAVALQSVQVNRNQLCFDLPAGWYYKLRNGGTGTHSEAFVSGQQTIYG